MVARKSQTRPLRMEVHGHLGITTTSEKCEHPHLSPHEMPQAKDASFMEAQADQANEHYEQ